jgi:hypothetical protein
MLENITLTGNKIYNDRIELGYGNEANRTLRLFDNYMPNGALIKYWTDVQASGNTFFYKNLYSCALNFILLVLRISQHSSLTTINTIGLIPGLVTLQASRFAGRTTP